MTIIDFHPDDLLEREIAGTLSSADERRLAAHVARCASCRLERQLRMDFDQELGAQSAPMLLSTLVSGALRAAHAPDAASETKVESLRSAPVRRSKRRVAALLAAGVALGAGLAAARSELGGRAIDFVSGRVGSLLGVSSKPRADAAVETEHSPSSQHSLPAPASPAPGVAAAPAVAAVSEPSPRAAVEVDTPRSEPPAAAASSSASKHRSKLLEAALPPPATSRFEAETTARAGAPERQPDEAHETSAAILFDRANAARRLGVGAEAHYRELQARFPSSAEARLSYAIVGRMQLDAADAQGALASFELYLASGDRALREQSMAGRALAWGRLGDGERERQSWLALLAAYPESAYSSLARRRLAQDRP